MKISLKSLSLENNSNKTLYQTYLDTLNKFLSTIENNYDSIILCGSFAKNKLQTGSDIDLVLIEKSKDSQTSPKEIEIKDFIINQITISTITTNKETLLKKIKDEKLQFTRLFSHLLSSGIILDGVKVNNIVIKEATKVIKSPVPKLNKKELDLIYNFISDHRTLANDYLKRYDDIAFFTRFSFAIQNVIQIYFKLKKQIIPNWKFTAKNIHNKKFKEALQNFYTQNNKEEKYKQFILLLDSLQKLLKEY